MLRNFIYYLFFATFFSLINPKSIDAQIVPDNSLGSESSIVSPNLSVKDNPATLIEGGAIRNSNLFHSFAEFNIGEGERVYFANPEGIQNIFSRVTGSNLSQIFGTLGVKGNANLLLLNPYGIIFGNNAQLDLNGSFVATTAESVLFNDNITFGSNNPQPIPLLTINTPIGLQFGNKAEPIINRSQVVNELGEIIGIAVNPEQNITLLAGDILFEAGYLTVPNGRIEVASVAPNSVVKIIPAENTWTLNSQNSNSFQNISLTEGSVISSSGDGAGNIHLQSNKLSILDSSKIVADNFGLTNGGSIIIEARELVEVSGIDENGGRSSINADTYNSGQGANISIDTALLQITDGAYISADSYSEGIGGSITINVRERIDIIGSETELYSGISTDTYGSGDAGNLTINTGSLFLQSRAYITSNILIFDDISDPGDGGNLAINATDSIELSSPTNGAFFDSYITTDIFIQNNLNPQNFVAGSANGGSIKIVTPKLLLENAALTALTGKFGDTGNIELEVKDLKLTSGSQIFNSTYGAGNVGNININASSIELAGVSTLGFPTAIDGSPQSGSTGNAGNIQIKVESLRLTDGAQILNSTFGAGNGGFINIQANDIELIGTNPEIFVTSAIAVSADGNSTGNAGDINLKVGNLHLFNGAQIGSGTFSQGKGGNVNIEADLIILSGVDSQLFAPTNLYASADLNSTGDGGNLNIKATKIEILDGAQITSGTRGEGNGGNIEIQTDNLILSGSDLVTGSGSIISASVQANATGNSGNLNINATTIEILDGAQIGSGTFGEGNSGDINIQANNIEIKGSNANPLLFYSGIFASVEPQAIGNGGDINLTVDNLVVRDGGKISLDTRGDGMAGNLNINAQNIEVVGVAVDKLLLESDSKTAFSRISALSTENFQAGSIVIHANSLKLDDRGLISVSNFGNGDTGNIEINTTDLSLNNFATIEAQVNSGNRGNINLNSDRFLLVNNSQITTNAMGEATGGNININTINLVSVEESSITANSVNSFGGKISIDTQGKFISSDSTITAFGKTPQFDGIVQINTPDLDPNSGLVKLSNTTLKPSQVIATSCRIDAENTFIVSGKDGLPMSPFSPQIGTLLWQDLRTLDKVNISQVEEEVFLSQKQPIVEAQGWQTKDNGIVELIAKLDRTNYSNPSFTCQ
jgi:filamentous hemagglutinin family protein